MRIPCRVVQTADALSTRDFREASMMKGDLLIATNFGDLQGAWWGCAQARERRVARDYVNLHPCWVKNVVVRPAEEVIAPSNATYRYADGRIRHTKIYNVVIVRVAFVEATHLRFLLDAPRRQNVYVTRHHTIWPRSACKGPGVAIFLERLDSLILRTHGQGHENSSAGTVPCGGSIETTRPL